MNVKDGKMINKKTTFLFLFIGLFLTGCSASVSINSDDKVYYAIGDSITWLEGQKYGDSDETAIGYPIKVAEGIGFDKVLNKGVNGGSLAKSSKYPENGSILLDNDFSDANYADIITILAGTNDFKLDVPLGEINSDDETTFYGAYNQLLDELQDENSEAKILLVTPLHRNNGGYKTETTNKAGYRLEDYRQAVIALAKKHDLQLIDLFETSLIQDDNLEKYTVDGLHPNAKGFEILADEIINGINNK